MVGVLRRRTVSFLCLERGWKGGNWWIAVGRVAGGLDHRRPEASQKMRCLDASPPKLEYYRGFPEVPSADTQRADFNFTQVTPFLGGLEWGISGRSSAGGWVQ